MSNSPWNATISAWRTLFKGVSKADSAALRVESLEVRNVPAVTASFDSLSGILSVLGDSDDDNIVIVENGGVDVIGVTIVGGPVSASAVKFITVDGDGGNDTIDLRGVSVGTGFTSLSGVDIHGGGGNDLIYGATDFASGYQDIEGGLGNDTLQGGNGNDTLVGGFFSNTDDQTDFFGNDLIDGGAGNDIIYGDDQYVPSSLPSGGGDDTITGGANDDVLIGGPGNDVYRFAESWGSDSIFDESGIDTVDFSALSINLTFTSNQSNLPANRPNNVDFDTNEIERYIGGSGNDTFSFGPGANFGNGSGVLDGGGGTNYLDYSLFGPGAVVTFGDPIGSATGIARFVNIQQAINAQVNGTPPPSSTGSLALDSAEKSLFSSDTSSSDESSRLTSTMDAESNFLEDSHDSHEGHEAAGGGSMLVASGDGDAGSENIASDPIASGTMDAGKSEDT